MLIRVDSASHRPLFGQVADAVRSAVLTGEAVAGERLPSARDLADSLDINVHTVLHAYQLLRDEGVIEMRRGRGAVIVAEPDHWSALHRAMKTVAAEAKTLKLTPDAATALMRSVLEKETS